jgi:PAS domain S-box-containing protein
VKQDQPSEGSSGRDANVQEAEDRFRTAFEDAPTGLAILDLEGHFLRVNEALCRLLGRGRGELQSLTWRDVTHPKDRAIQEAYERDALEGGDRTFQWEKRYVRPDGADVWTLTSRSLVRDEQGVPLYFISQVVDISSSKVAEEALRAREEETRRILETAQDAFISMNAQGEITDWNRQAEVIFGWSRDDAAGRQMADTIIPPRFREAHRRGLKTFLETGDGPVLNRRLELVGLRRNGEEFPIEITIWPLPAGAEVRFNALVHDISERTESQAQLNRQREELGALHETTLDLIRRLEPTSLLGAILSRAASLIGTDHGYFYVLDERAGELVVRAGIGLFAEFLGYRLKRGDGLAGRVWESGEPLFIDDYHTWEGGLPEFSMIHAAMALPLRAANEIVGVMGLVHLEEGKPFGPEQQDLLSRFARLASVALDNARLYSAAQDELRERRRAEKELERTADDLKRANEELLLADELKSHFVAVTSHELRTPLTSVLGFAKTLLKHWDRIPDEEKKEQIRLIEDQSGRLTRLVEELLTLSKIEAGALDVHPQPIRVEEAVQSVVSSFGEPGSRIEVEIPRQQRVLADPDHFHQMLTNYIANALKYGRAPYTIDSRVENGLVEIRVSDSGDGVPEAFVPRLFERFAQAGSGAGGTGLGLSIVRGLALAQGGDAWYEPCEPHGGCFGIRLLAA